MLLDGRGVAHRSRWARTPHRAPAFSGCTMRQRRQSTGGHSSLVAATWRQPGTSCRSRERARGRAPVACLWAPRTLPRPRSGRRPTWSAGTRGRCRCGRSSPSRLDSRLARWRRSRDRCARGGRGGRPQAADRGRDHRCLGPAQRADFDPRTPARRPARAASTTRHARGCRWLQRSAST